MSFNKAYAIMREECEWERIPVAMMRSGKRTRTILLVRQRICERLRCETDLSLVEIAQVVGLRSAVRQRPRHEGEKLST